MWVDARYTCVSAWTAQGTRLCSWTGRIDMCLLLCFHLFCRHGCPLGLKTGDFAEWLFLSCLNCCFSAFPLVVGISARGAWSCLPR